MLTRYSNKDITQKIKQFISDYGTNTAPPPITDNQAGAEEPSYTRLTA